MLALDRRTETRQERSRFASVRTAEVQYARALRSIAQQIGAIVTGFAGDNPFDHDETIREALRRYSDLIEPWARITGARMLAEVSRRDESAWNQAARRMTRALSLEIKSAPTGEILRERLAEQVRLIRSLPLEAAQRVHHFTLLGLETAARADEAAAEIMRSGHVARSRAVLIARTETARTASVLVEARAKYVGSEGYIWRTVGDADVRPLHRALAGKFIRWDNPPVAGSNGVRAHAGQIYNCRCHAEPVIPEEAEAA